MNEHSDAEPKDTAAENHPDQVEIVLAQFGQMEVVENGSLIFPYNERAYLFPLRADPTYRIGIQIEIDEAADTTSSVEVANDEVIIKIKRRFIGGLSTAHYALGFAETEKHRYYLYIALSMVGNPERYVNEFRYNVARRVRV